MLGGAGLWRVGIGNGRDWWLGGLAGYPRSNGGAVVMERIILATVVGWNCLEIELAGFSV